MQMQTKNPVNTAMDESKRDRERDYDAIRANIHRESEYLLVVCKMMVVEFAVRTHPM